MGRKVVGLMSGTSVDGIDAALVDIDGYGSDTKIKVINTQKFPFPEEVRKGIFNAMQPETSDVRSLCSLNVQLGYLYSEAVKGVCNSVGFSMDKLDLIGSHGQTIYHLPNPEKGYVQSTLQIGDPAVIAYETRTPVISQFRSMDIAAGGEGAPLVPYVDYLLYAQSNKSVALQNIGGIGNVTVIPAGATLGDIKASDTGPGNMMIDAACDRLFGVQYDKDGEIASKGEIITPLIDHLMEIPFLQQEPSKSTGRELFGVQLVERILSDWTEFPKNDIITTLTYFTAKTIEHHLKAFVLPINPVDQFIISGGGSYNKTLIGMIEKLLPACEVITLETIGQSSDDKEAVAFAVLANESWHGQCGNVLGATGASDRVILGQFTPDPFGKKVLNHFMV